MDHPKSQSPDGDQLWTVAEVARRLGVSGAYIRKLVAAEAIPHLRLGERAIRFDPADIEAWLEERKTFPGKAPAAEAGGAEEDTKRVA